MEVFLNRYGLVAIKLNCNLTLRDVGRKLEIDLDTSDNLMLYKAVQADEDRIGLYKDNLLLTVNDIFTFFDKELFGLVAKLSSTFEEQTFCAVYYYSIPDIFGYSYFEKGQRIRTKHGEFKDTWVDIGDELLIEKETESNADVVGRIVELVTDEKMTILFGKEIEMTKFKKKTPPR